MRDALVTLGLSLGLATLITSHASIVYGLLWRPPRWRALLALLLPPLSFGWALRERMFVRVIAFVLGGGAYALAAWDAYRRQ